jgi:methionine synthase II (cobalamin-independent)
VKQVLPGPYSAARAGRRSAASWADALRPTIQALAAAGCPFVEIDEFDALAITVVESERRRFVEAHRRLTDDVEGIHLSLALTGGDLDAAGPSTFFDLPYASYAFDLIAGPENWRLIAVAPADRGMICGALSASADADQTRELLVWAAHYAASTQGRGTERVGLANASSLAGLTRADALGRLRVVAEAARMAAVESPEELARVLDPRAVTRGRRARGRA